MPRITSIKSRILYNSRGSKTIEVDVIADSEFLGRVCAPSGASVGKYEAKSFPAGGPEESARLLAAHEDQLEGVQCENPEAVHAALRDIDDTPDYSVMGGAAAFATSIAAMQAASLSLGIPMHSMIFSEMGSEKNQRFPYPLGNVLGGGAHAGPGTPDIQEILVCPVGSTDIRDAIKTNIAVHREVRRVLESMDSGFTNGRGDEGGWAPKLDNRAALDACAKSCENLGFTLGREVALGVDFAASTQWNPEKNVYEYTRAGYVHDPGEQIEFVSDIIRDYNLIYAEDAVHEEAFEDMAQITSRFPDTMVTGDDLTVTNREILERAATSRSCNAAILKVNQAGSLHDALEFARAAQRHGIHLITSHRSGESTDTHISHIGIGTSSRMLKTGIVGGERVSKLNELLRLSEQGLICGMAGMAVQ